MTDTISPSDTPFDADPLYVAARRVLIDALTALSPHGRAVIVAGAQAIYLRTGTADLSIAPYTTDSDLALDPSLLGDHPALNAAMEAAGFHLLTQDRGRVEPGVWVASANIEGQNVLIPVDLIVPEGVAPEGGRRGARLGAHGNRAARRAVGLEAALVDHGPAMITALDSADDRSIEAEVAGLAALLVAKLHKLHDRVASARTDRLDDKDAADIVRIMQTTSASEVGATMVQLCGDPMAGSASTSALTYLDELFGRRGRPGIAIAARALRLALPEDRVEVLCLAYASALLAAAGPEPRS